MNPFVSTVLARPSQSDKTRETGGWVLDGRERVQAASPQAGGGLPATCSVNNGRLPYLPQPRAFPRPHFPDARVERLPCR